MFYFEERKTCFRQLRHLCYLLIITFERQYIYVNLDISFFPYSYVQFDLFIIALTPMLNIVQYLTKNEISISLPSE